jgi:hypothetical protein
MSASGFTAVAGAARSAAAAGVKGKEVGVRNCRASAPGMTYSARSDEVLLSLSTHVDDGTAYTTNVGMICR